MTGQSADPLSIAVLVGFIVALLGVIYRELRGQIADRDRAIAKLEAQVDGMATRTTSLAATSERMLQYFLDREDRNRKEAERERSASP